MNHIDIDGKLVREVLAELQLSVIELKIKELSDEIDKLEKLLDYSIDYDAVSRTFRFFG